MDIKTPDLGVDSADVSEILVKVGDTVEKEQSLLVLESAKASVEVPSPASGIIQRIVIAQGQSVKQGDVLFELESDNNEKTASVENATSADNSKNKSGENTSSEKGNVDESEPAELKSVESDSAELAQQTSADSENGIKDVKVPDLGVDEADVSEVLVSVGDTIEKEQSLIVLESAKASVEVPSPVSGVVREVQLKTGQKVKQGMVILSIEAGEDNQSETLEKTASQASKTTAPAQQDPHKNALQQANQQQANHQKTGSLTEQQISANSEVYAGPAVRQLARQLGVVLSQVKPSGTNQRIIKEDVFAFVKQELGANQQDASGQQLASTGALPALPDFEKFGGSTVQPMTRLQQVSVPQLSLNNFIPQVTQFDLADITALENWRSELKAGYKKQDISLTILAFIVKAVAYLLKQEPYFNSHLADDQKSIVLRNEIHMGIAVATQDGLTVPVLRHPDALSIKEIAIQLGELSQKARDKKLKPQELQGASFTITSLGSIGGTAFTPLVNWPQVAILGISPATMQPVWNGKEFEPRLMLPLSLSYDHRVINGADAARFSHALTQILGDIRRVLL
jgi:pyruvate dehydrogenase E2 component (dihydrolipoamide acetyltransferase)